VESDFYDLEKDLEIFFMTSGDSIRVQSPIESTFDRNFAAIHKPLVP